MALALPLPWLSGMVVALLWLGQSCEIEGAWDKASQPVRRIVFLVFRVSLHEWCMGTSLNILSGL